MFFHKSIAIQSNSYYEIIIETLYLKPTIKAFIPYYKKETFQQFSSKKLMILWNVLMRISVRYFLYRTLNCAIF